MSNDIGRLVRIVLRAGIRQFSRENDSEGTEAEASSPQNQKPDDLAVGVIMTGFGLFMLLLGKTGGHFAPNELTPYAVLLIGSGLVSLVIGAVRTFLLRGTEADGAAALPETGEQEKKLAEQKQLLDSGLTSKEEYNESCAAIRDTKSRAKESTPYEV